MVQVVVVKPWSRVPQNLECCMKSVVLAVLGKPNSPCLPEPDSLHLNTACMCSGDGVGELATARLRHVKGESRGLLCGRDMSQAE